MGTIEEEVTTTLERQRKAVFKKEPTLSKIDKTERVLGRYACGTQRRGGEERIKGNSKVKQKSY